MNVAINTYNKIEPLIYNQERAPADDIELQRERWYEDLIEGGGSVKKNADVELKQPTSNEPNTDEF